MASRLVADIVRDFESDLTSLVLRPFDDGRFTVRAGGKSIFDKHETGRFPDYERDVKAQLELARS